MVALGYSVFTVPDPAVSESVVSEETIGCGSVFSPRDEASCEDERSSRQTLMLAIGLPGVAVGLGLVFVASRRDFRT